MVSVGSIQSEINIDAVKTKTVEQLILPLIHQVTLELNLQVVPWNTVFLY